MSGARSRSSGLGRLANSLAGVLTSCLLLPACDQPRAPDADPAKVRIARLLVKQYADQAYSMWARSHPDKQCPDSIAELATYVDHKPDDPWGNPLRMACGDRRPERAVTAIGITSLGPDGKPDTDDDIRSWE